MTPVDQAFSLIINTALPLKAEKIPLIETAGRILHESITAEINIPAFDNSAMDGYALRFRETTGAAKKNPVSFIIIGEMQAGGAEMPPPLGEGEALRIMTGAPMPEGADAVIPVEDTREEENRVLVYKELKINENVRFAGEDISTGDSVLNPGRCITSADVGLLASLNCEILEVFRRPTVAIIATGDEIVEPGEEVRFGQIRNSNAYTLYSEVQKYGGEPHYLGIARDSKEETKALFQKALSHDVVITTGGVSMGKYDFVKEVMADLGVEILIEKIRMKPGKPVVFGHREKTLFFGLPGNPVSTMIAFIQFVRPALLKLSGSTMIDKPELLATLQDPIKKKPGRRHFVRGFFTIEAGRLAVSTTGAQGSGILRSMSDANCLIVVPEDIEYIEAGQEVMIQLINHGEI